MILQELHIEGFRSLRSVTWNPGRLNVLIGPNGGGKSNLLRALDLLRIAATGDLRNVILRMGGMAPLVWDGEARQILFALTARDESEVPLTFKYKIVLSRLGNTGGFEVGPEELSCGQGVAVPDAFSNSRDRLTTDRGANVEVLFRRLENFETASLMDRLSNPLVPKPSEAMLSSASIGTPSYAFQQIVREWSVHHDMRVDREADLRRPTVTRADRRVEAEGQNLIPVLHTLYENDREFEGFLDKAMSAAFPNDYDKLSFPPEADGRTELRIRRKHRKRADSAADLSDGTMRFLLLIAILGSPDPAPLIAIDEPETGLHPRMMSIVAEVAANAARKSQVILSTQSPSLLDAFEGEPPTTTILTSDGSETKLKTTEGETLKHWIENYSLGKFVFSGEADAVL